MELELGLKITKTRDDISSISEYQLAKDKGPVFHSRETNTTFILTAHLKGYKRNNIDIKISKDGSKLTISGEKPIQEMVMIGWVMHKKVVNVTGFNKVFKIPDGVNLDRIKAKYDEDEWILSIVMPKLVKGIYGLKIEEVKEQEFDKSETDNVSSSVGETSQKGSKEYNVSEECLIQQSGKSKQKAFGESKCETEDAIKEYMKEGNMEPCEDMKVSEVDDQNLVDHIPSNIGEISQKELMIQQMERTKITKGKIDEKSPHEEKTILGDIIQKNNIKPKTETENEDQECVTEKPDKEGSDAMEAIKEKFPKHLPKTTLEESEEFNVQNMQEIKDVEKEMIERKGKEKGSEGFKVEKEEEQKVMIKEEKVDTEILMESEEGEESKKRKEEADKVLHDANKQMHDERIKKEVRDSKMGIGDGNGKGVRKKVGKEEHEVMKIFELEKNVGVCIPQRIEDTDSKDNKSEVQKMDRKSVEKKERRVSDKIPDDSNRGQAGSTIKKEREESKLRIDDGKVKGIKEKIGKAAYEAMKSLEQEQNLGACATQNTGITEDSLIQQSGKSKQNEFGEPKCEFEDRLKENMKKSSMELSEAMKGSELDDISQKDLEDYRIQQMKKSTRTKEKIDGDSIQNDIIKPKIETENEDQECIREKTDKEGSDTMAAIKEEFPKHLPKTTLDESEEMNVQKKQEIKDHKEEMIKRKGKEKGEGERHKTMHVGSNRGIMRDTIEEEIEKRNNGTEDTAIQDKDTEVQKMKSRSVEKKEGKVSDKMVDDDNEDQTGIAIKKGREESKMRIDDGKVKGMIEKIGKETYEAVKTSEIEQDAGAGFPQNIGDISQDKEFKDQEMVEKGSVVEIKEGEGEKSIKANVGEEGCEEIKSSELEKNVGASSTQISGVTSQGVSKEYLTQQSRESKQKQFGESKSETEDRLKETMKKKNDDRQYKKESVEANKDVENIIFGDIIQKDITKVASIREEFPKHLPKPTLEESEDLNVQKMKEIKDVKEEMIKTKRKQIEYFEKKGEGERHKKMLGEENKGITRERMQAKIEKIKNGVDESGQQHIGENIVKGVFEVPKSITEELSKQLKELDGSKEVNVAKEEEQKEVTKEATTKTEILMAKMEEDSNKRNEEVSRDSEKSTVIETLLKKTEEPNIEKKSSDGPIVQDKLPKQVVEAIPQNEKNKTEHGIVKLKEKGSIKMHVEPNEAFENDTTWNRIEKEIRKQKLESGDQLSLKEDADNGIFDGRKRQKFPEMEEAEDGAKNEGYVKKVNGDKYEKIHVETNEDLKKEITKETRGEQIKDPKIRTKEKGEHHLHEEVSKERSQESKAAKELYIRDKFPEHLPKTTLEESEELDVQKKQEMKDVKEEIIKRKGKDIEYFVEKGEGERQKTIHVDANKSITRETIEDDMEKRKNGIGDSGQQHLEKNTVKGRFELPKSITEELPKKLVELDGSKGFKVAAKEKQEMIKAEKNKTECFMEKEEGEDSKKITEVADMVLDDANKEIKEEGIKKEVGESKMGIGDGNGKGERKKVGKEEHEVVTETLELDKTVGVCIPQRIEDTTSKDKKSEVQEMDSRIVENKEGRDEFPKHLPKATLEESEELNVQKMQEIIDVKEVMIKRKGKEIEYSEEKGEGERYKTMHVEENKGIKRETVQEKIEKKKNGVDEIGQQHVGENIVKGVFEAPKSIIEELPKQLEELDESKNLKVAKEEEQKELTKEAKAKTETLLEKMEGEDSKKRNEDASSGTEKNTVIETLLKKTEESNNENNSSDGPLVKEKLSKKVVEEIAEVERNETEHGIVKLKVKGSMKMHVEPNDASENDTAENRIEKDIRKKKLESSDQLSVKDTVDKEIMDGRKREKFAEMEEAEDGKEDAGKMEESMKKVNGDKYEKIQVEANEDFKKEITKETKWKAIEDPKIQTKEKVEHHMHEEMSKKISQKSKSAKEDFSMKVLDSPTKSRGLKEAKMEKIEDIKEEDAENEQFVNIVKEEKYEKIQVGGNGGLRNETTKDTVQKEKEEPKILIMVKDQQSLQDDMRKGRYETNTTARGFPMQIVDSLAKTRERQKDTKIEAEETKGELSKSKSGERKAVDPTTKEKFQASESKRKTEESNIEKKSSDGPLVKEKLPKQVVEEIAEVEKNETEHGIVKLKGKGSMKMHVEPNDTSENDTAENRTEKDIRKQKFESSDQLSVKDTVDKGILDGRKGQKFAEMEEDAGKIEQPVKKVNRDKYEKIQVEANEDFKKEITKETKGKAIEDPKIQTKEKAEHHLHEEMSKKISQESKSTKEDFPLKELDSSTDRRGLKEAKMEKIEDIKEEDAENEQFVYKVKEEKYEKIQVGGNRGLRNETTKDTVQKEKEEPKILIMVKDQQSMQDDMRKGRYEASTTAREFPMQIVDSLAMTRERQKDTEIEAEETKGEMSKSKSRERKAVEPTTKKKFQASESKRITQSLHEAPEEKHPEDERELPSERDTSTCAEVVNMEFKEVEQGRAKEKKQTTNLPPPKIPSRETRDLEDEGINQKNLKPLKIKVGEQSTYNTKGTKEVATKEDQEIKQLSSPRFPSIHQSEVEEKYKFYEGGKAKYEASRESQKEDPTKDMQNLVEMKEKENQEAKLKEALKSEAPLEKQIKKGGQVIRRGEFHKGKNVGEKMQEKTEGPEKNFDDRDHQYVAIDVGKVETVEEEMFKEYEAEAGSIAERMESKKGLKTTLVREDYMTTQNVNDEKPKIQDEITKTDIEKVNKEKRIQDVMKTTQEKEHPIKSEAVEKETEYLEAISSLPNVTSMGIKEASPEIEDLHQKELSPLKAEMKGKEPLELENSVIQWKIPKTKEQVPLIELRGKEQHDYVTKEIEELKMAAYEEAKPSKFQRPTIIQQSTDEENRKSENAVEEHEATKEPPKKNIVETEKIDSFQPEVLENQYFEEQNVDERDEALDQCEFQGPKVSIQDRGQQLVQDNNDNKGSQTPKAVEEEIFLKKGQGSKVAKSGEAKYSSRNKREGGKTTQTAEENKPTMKEKTPHFKKASGSKQVANKMHETGDREHQIESEEVTASPKMRVEPPTMIEKTPNKEVERKEPRELTWPNMDYKTPKISEVQEEKEGERHVHALEANISRQELAQATTIHSKTKSKVEPKGENEIDKPQVNQLPSSSIEMLSKEPQESEECNMKDCDSKGESLVQVSEKEEPIQSTDTASEEVSVKDESQGAKKKDSKLDAQEPNKSKRDQQCINKGEEEKHGINEIEEEKACEEGSKEPEEYKEEASGGKKDNTMSKKLFVPLVIAGSALLGVIFVWQRRTRKR